MIGDYEALANVGNTFVAAFQVDNHQDAAGIFRETSDRHSEDIALRNVDADRTAQAEDGGRE